MSAIMLKANTAPNLIKGHKFVLLIICLDIPKIGNCLRGFSFITAFQEGKSPWRLMTDQKNSQSKWVTWFMMIKLRFLKWPLNPNVQIFMPSTFSMYVCEWEKEREREREREHGNIEIMIMMLRNALLHIHTIEELDIQWSITNQTLSCYYVCREINRLTWISNTTMMYK